MHWTRVLADGGLLSALATIVIFGSLYANPRIWLNDFPPDLRSAVPPKTDAEKRQSMGWGVPLMVLLLGAPTVSSVLLERELGGTAPFATLFLNAFGVALIFNLVDLVLIDWLVICTWTPRWLVIPGTEGMAGYKDYRHHFRGFLIGTVFSAVVGLIAAAIAYLI